MPFSYQPLIITQFDSVVLNLSSFMRQQLLSRLMQARKGYYTLGHTVRRKALRLYSGSDAPIWRPLNLESYSTAKINKTFTIVTYINSNKPVLQKSLILHRLTSLSSVALFIFPNLPLLLLSLPKSCR